MKPLDPRRLMGRFLVPALFVALFVMTVIMDAPRPPAVEAQAVADGEMAGEDVEDPVAPEESPLNIVGTAPLPGEGFTGRLLVLFNEDLQPITDEHGRLVPPLSFEPGLSGTCEILRNCIIYTVNPGVSIPNGQQYTVSIHPDLLSVSGKSLSTELAPITFVAAQSQATPANQTLAPAETPTPAPAADSTSPAAPLFVKEVNRHPSTYEQIVLNFHFSSPVAPEALKGKLKITDRNGITVNPEISALGTSESCLVTLPSDTPLPVLAVLENGLSDISGTHSLKEDYFVRYPLFAAIKLQSADWRREESNDGQIHLYFSAPVNSEALRRYITVTDDVSGEGIPFSPVTGGDLQNPVLQLNVNTRGRRALALDIAAGMPDTKLGMTSESIHKTLGTPVRALDIAYAYWDDQGVDGAIFRMSFNANVELSALKEHLTVNPEVANFTVESGGYRQGLLKGDWRAGVSYQLTISPGLFDTSGDYGVKKPYTYPMEAAPKVAGVGFGYPGKVYFPRRASGLMPLEARNKKETQVTLYQLFPSNIVDAMDYLENGETHDGYNQRLARKIASKTIAFPDAPDTRVSANLDIRDLLPAEERGVFSLALSNADDYRNTKIVVWTNIGVLSHWQNDQLVVFVHDLFSLEPIPLAKVTAYSSKNQPMGAANTDDQGIAILSNLDKSLGTPRVAVVETANDSTFLDLLPEEGDVKAYAPDMAAYDPEGYDAFLYTDRNLYRPSETIHARWIVRTHYGDALPEVPLEVRLVNPKDNVLLTTPTTLSALGTGGTDFATEKSFLTGRYKIQLQVPGSDTPLAIQTVNVEEFVPNRIKTEVALAEDRWLAGKPYNVEVGAQHLFGAPAADRRCEAAVILRKGAFTSERWAGFRFTNDTDYTDEVRSLGEGKTNAEGKASFAFTYQPTPKVSFPLRATVRGQVFELGGRSVIDAAETTLFPADICLGIAAATQGETDVIDISVAAIRPDESPADLASVKVSIERETWNYYVRRYRGYNEPRWDKSFETLQSVDVPLTEGRGVTQLTVPGYGYYRVRVSSDATPQFSTLNFYKYWRRIEVVNTARPSLIKLSIDKPEYAIGDEVELRIESPFDGAGLVVLQSGNIEEAARVEVKNNVGVLRFSLDRACYPNAWIEATVVHQVQPGQAGVYPYSSFAMINVPMKDPKRRIEIDYPGLPEEMRPAQDLNLAVETRDSAGNPIAAEVTLAAVDEGIHAILDYQDPDPCAWFERSRRPDFKRAHYYDQVAYDFDMTPFGGDTLLAKRLGKGSEVGENWIKPVALWAGVVNTDAEGKGTISLHVPEFDGQLRLVAVAVTPTATGAHSAKLFVRRPYIVRTSMPRFALPGDTFQCRATIFNTTANPCRAKVAWAASGALAAGSGSKEVEIPAGKEASLLADFAASSAIGQGAIDWTTEIFDTNGQSLDKISQSAPIPVLVPAAFKSKNELSILEVGETRSFSNIGFIENDQLETTLSLSANPMLRLEEALKYVVGYPYGCVEQTTSRCLPTYLLRQSAALLQGAMPEQNNLDNYVRAGIDRLFSMQTPSGGFAYWPGGVDPYPYGSIYACHFLTLVHRDHSFDMPEDGFKALQKYVRALANSWQGNSPSTLFRRAYAHYVLALDGDQAALEQISRFDSIVIPRSARYLLAAALALNTKDPERVANYLANAPSEPYTQRETYDTLNSEIRNAAIELLSLIEMNGNAEEIQTRVTELIRYLESRPYYTTQDNAFVISALGLYLSRVAANLDSAKANITLPGDTVEPFAGPGLYRSQHKGPGGTFTVANTGAAPLYVNFTLAGIPERAEMKAVSEGITIHRSIRGSQGSSLNAMEFQQGDSYLITLAINCKVESMNVIVADLLPAGFEIENPRLDADALAGQKIEGAVTPSYFEIRDDRLVVAFDRLSQGTGYFHYLVRAVTPGAFQYPPVSAECMYDPAVRGVSMPGTVEIK